MESGYSQATAGINWDEWSRIVEAAQDPRHRDAVQQFLARADLSADVPAALDEKLLAPRRAEGATGEQCAYVLCNLGFASLVAATQGSAEFAMACGRLVEQLDPNTPDLVLRRHFLSTKGKLVVAALTDQPHLLWSSAAERCTAYLRALDQHLEGLPAESVESNAMAAYAFAAQCLSRIENMNAVEHYAEEISQLVETALGLHGRLPATFAARMWRRLMPGTDAGALFRHSGAVAERSLQIGADSFEHAATGIRYLEEMLAQVAGRPPADLERHLLTKAELLLLSGRHAEAREQAAALEGSSDPPVREGATVITAWCNLLAGSPQAALESLARLAPTREQALESWRATWAGDHGDGRWTEQSAAPSRLEDTQNTWRLQALAAADSQDMPGFLEAADRISGFFVDSLVRDSRGPVEPMAAIDEVLSRLADGTALLQLINTKEGFLTWVARKRDGDLSLFVAPERPNARRLIATHKSWSRVHFESLGDGAGSPESEDKGAALFTTLMHEVRRNWGELLQGQLEDGVTQLILIGDDFADIPLHATRVGDTDDCLIDRVPVTYVPSLSALRACIDRSGISESARKGIELRSLLDSKLDAVAAGAVATILETEPCELAAPIGDALWTDLAAARVLHIAARASHNARKPLDSVLGAGWLDVSIGQLMARLDLAHCDLVSNLHCESALPSMLRAPGLDLAAVFLAAGARSVLASTWVADDELASALTRMFFQHWVTGQAPAAAFRGALLDLRSEHPALADFQWAGMRLVGAP